MISRVQHRHLHCPQDNELIEWLTIQGVQVPDMGLIRLFQNSPLALLNHLQTVQQESTIDQRRSCVEGLFALLNQPETLFDYTKLIAEDVGFRLQILFYLLHDLHKLKLSNNQVDDNAVFAFANPQLQIWQKQISLQELRVVTSELLKTRNLLVEHSALRKELLINALLIKIKNAFQA